MSDRTTFQIHGNDALDKTTDPEVAEFMSKNGFKVTAHTTGGDQ